MSATVPPEPRDTAAPGAGSTRRDGWDRNVIAVCATIALSAVTLAFSQCATNRRIDDTNAQVGDIRAEMRAEHAEMRAEHAEMRAEHVEMRAEHAEMRAEHAEMRAEMRAIHGLLAEIRENVAVLMDRELRRPETVE